MDSLGPFSIDALRDMAKNLAHKWPRAANVHVLRADDPTALDGLLKGDPTIILWNHGADTQVGHFFLLMWLPDTKAGTRRLELFDPLGSLVVTPAGATPWEDYMDDTEGVNVGLRGLMQTLDAAGIEVHYSPTGPQPVDASSCGLHCLLRVLLWRLPVSEFSKAVGGK
jgi:hypothetical protein